MPWMPWSAAVYDYNSKNESKYDPEGYCLPPGGPRMMATPYQMEIIQQPEHKRIIMIFEGATHIWREIYMDGRKFPEGDALNPTYLGYSIGRWRRRHARRREQGLQREQLARLLRPSAHRQDARRRAVDAAEQGSTLHYEATVTDPGAYTRPFTMAWDIPWTRGRRAARVHLPGEQPVPESPGGRSGPADLRSASAAWSEAVDRDPLGGTMSDDAQRFCCALVLALAARAAGRRARAVRPSAEGAVERAVGPEGQPEAPAARPRTGTARTITGVDQSGRRTPRTVKTVTFDYTDRRRRGRSSCTAEGKDAAGKPVHDQRRRHAREHRRLLPALPRHLDAGRQEGRVHGHAQLDRSSPLGGSDRSQVVVVRGRRTPFSCTGAAAARLSAVQHAASPADRRLHAEPGVVRRSRRARAASTFVALQRHDRRRSITPR